MLFHMEHFEGLEWYFRWRILGPYPPRYLEWREDSCTSSRMVFHPEVALCEVEAQWRAGREEEWRQAALREASAGKASFHVRAEEDFSKPGGFRVVAALSGELVSVYSFGPLVLAAGLETVIEGVADGPYLDNVLLRDGDFTYTGEGLSIRNVGSSEGSLVEVGGDVGRLAVIPGSMERRVYARKVADPLVVAAVLAMDQTGEAR